MTESWSRGCCIGSALRFAAPVGEGERRFRAARIKAALALAFVLLVGCSENYSIDVAPGESAGLSVRTLFVDATADGRDERTQKLAVEVLARMVPSIRVVEHPALADASLSWVIMLGKPCIDCGESFEKGWRWSGWLRESGGSGVVTFTGWVPARNCCPDAQFLQQVGRYLRKHPTPFDSAADAAD